MKILVDTCIWSQALRRKVVVDEPIIQELRELIQEQRVQIIGQIRQEILSGISTEKQFQQLQKTLSAFSDLTIHSTVYETAAKYFNSCRVKGIQGSSTDFLICAVSTYYDLSIFTTDKDFIQFQKIIPIKLHKLRRNTA